LHGIVLYFVLNSVKLIYPITSLGPLLYWLLVLFTGFLLILISAVTYRFIEHPFIQKIKPSKKDPTPVAVIDKVI